MFRWRSPRESEVVQWSSVSPPPPPPLSTSAPAIPSASPLSPSIPKPLSFPSQAAVSFTSAPSSPTRAVGHRGGSPCEGETPPFALCLLSDNGHIASWNEQCRLLKGLSSFDAIGKHYYNLFGPLDETQRLHPDLELFAARAQGSVTRRSWAERADGSRYVQCLQITPLFNNCDSGELVLPEGSGAQQRMLGLKGYLLVFQDEDPWSSRTGESLANLSQQLLLAGCNNLQRFGCYCLDPNGRVLAWNRGAEELTGFAFNEAVGSRIDFFYGSGLHNSSPPGVGLDTSHSITKSRMSALEFETFPPQLLPHQPNPKSVTLHGWRRTKRGREFFASIVVTGVYSPLPPHSTRQLLGFFVLLQDLTEQRCLEWEKETAKTWAREEVEAREREVARFQENQRQFSTRICHEIRNPLSGVFGNLELMGESIQRMHERIASLPAAETIQDGLHGMELELEQMEQSIDNMWECAKHQKAITDEVLSLASLEVAGGLELNPVPTDPVEVCKSAIQMFQAVAIAKGLKVQLQVSLRKEPCMVIADSKRLREVLSNLLSNAIKFTPSPTSSNSGLTPSSPSSAPASPFEVTSQPLLWQTRMEPAPMTTGEYHGRLEPGVIELKLEEYKEGKRPSHSRLRFTIEDSGIGIEPQKIEELFCGTPTKGSDYHQGELGLTICQQLCRLMGGDLRVHSEGSWRGTTATFDILCERIPTDELPSPAPSSTSRGEPLLVDDTTPSSSRSNSPEPFEGPRAKRRKSIVEAIAAETSVASTCASDTTNKAVTLEIDANSLDLTTMRILIVEDNRINQRVLFALLKKLGCIVDVANDGVEALEKALAAEKPYDLILMDVTMPRMTGIEATRLLRRREDETNAARPTPIVALSSHAQEQDRQVAFEAGMNDYITKPFSKQELYRKVLQYFSLTRHLERSSSKGAGGKSKKMGGKEREEEQSSVGHEDNSRILGRRGLIENENIRSSPLLWWSQHVPLERRRDSI